MNIFHEEKKEEHAVAPEEGKFSTAYLEHNAGEVAQHGHAATDERGHALVIIDEMEERKLRWKIDLHVIPIISLLYLFCFIDRSNVGNARLAGLEEDLGMTGYDYNILLTAFYTPYVAFEIPLMLLVKIYGPGKIIPLFSFLFGLFAFATGFVHSFGAAIVCRFGLGVAEGAIFPGMAYYLSRWYKKDELAFRLALYVVCAPLSGAFGGLLASGILQIDSIGWLTRWRLIFFVEGLATMLVGIASWFLVTDSIDSAKWLSPEEKTTANARLKAENPGARDVIDKLTWTKFKAGVFNVTTLGVALIFLLNNITVQGMGFFLPTIMRTIYPGSTTVQLQLKTVPPYIVGAFTTLLFPYLSMRTGKRGIWFLISGPFVIAGFACFVGTTNPQVRFAGTFLIAIGAFSFGALCNAWASINCCSDTTRNAAIGTTVFCGNLGGLIATWTYLPNQAPNYYPANQFQLGAASVIFVASAFVLFWQIRLNKKKDAGHYDHLLEGKTEDEIEDLGVEHPGFRYRN